MGKTIIEKILGAHADAAVSPGDIVDLAVDVRVARDFGGANVVQRLREHGLGIADPTKTFFTFDCNPTGSDQGYANNQQICRVFARETGVRVLDIDRGIGTHQAIDQGWAVPGSTLVSTDSHANVLGAIGAFGQGMGDVDIAHAFAHGRVWFQVPPTVKIALRGTPGPWATSKDLVLAMLRELGAGGLLGCAAELYGPAVERLRLAGRVTVASMATEMGGIIALLPPNEAVLEHCANASGQPVEPVLADENATYVRTVEIDVDGLEPLISRPGHPEDVVPVAEVAGTRIDSAFVGSCTNGRLKDIRAAAEILRGRRVAPGVVLKVVPATDAIWRQCLAEGLWQVLKEAGALIGNAGCAGCAAGQIGQNGPGEVTVSTGNRNFVGKQGRGEVYLASPTVAAASAIAGAITVPDAVPESTAVVAGSGTRTREGASAKAGAKTRGGKGAKARARKKAGKGKRTGATAARPTSLSGRLWVIRQDHVDTDMIFHNRHLAVTDIAEMGQYALGHLQGWEDFAQKAQPGDIVAAGKNFGAGSSRQQAVDCFRSLGIALLIAESFGAIYQRNAINSGFPIVIAPLAATDVQSGESIEVDLATGRIATAQGGQVTGAPWSSVQMDIYQRGGLLQH